MTAKALDPIKAKTLKGKALRQYKQTITLSQMQREVLVGTLRTNRRRLYTFTQRARPIQTNASKGRLYMAFIWAFWILWYFVGTPPQVQAIRGGGARDRQCIRLKTYSHPEFNFYDHLFYPAHGALRALTGSRRDLKSCWKYWAIIDSDSTRLLVHGRWPFWTELPSL